MTLRSLPLLRTARTSGRRSSDLPWRAMVVALRAMVVAWRAMVVLIVGAVAACGPSAPEEGEMAEFTIPSGAAFAEVTDTLVAHDLVGYPRLFRIFARLRSQDRSVRAGLYRVPKGTDWDPLLERLVEGRVVALPMTVPEGFTLAQMSARIADATGLTAEEVEHGLRAEGLAQQWDLPGPGLEGYLFPDTYHFTPGTSLEAVLGAMVGRYKQAWTPERKALARDLEMSEREVVTLASIVQAEARLESEMPLISAVFHNRLRLGYPLQADPTVQYALGERRERLLYADIDSVADHPYNTYTRTGLPPGPIGAPGEDALDATLRPAEARFLYFVARPDGSHVFTRSLEEHNRARAQARREWDTLQR